MIYLTKCSAGTILAHTSFIPTSFHSFYFIFHISVSPTVFIMIFFLKKDIIESNLPSCKINGCHIHCGHVRRENFLKNSLVVSVCYPVTSLMHAKVDRISGKPTWDRAFCIRMKSTLTKRGCHFKSSGYRVKKTFVG